ncbi:hypothetical protein LO772_29645 [Yinghuangia sp. ASG 101]|uniref:hypothetical protein n=1 Tax=Yinghuangia sp. ASG 101 TaxID=2896848 RepID=UPI001E353AF0|nr:hypothetical protein [Yinghuangia sp. ASG 101]UGQ10933.1 hypothetical protein LO772_29645 [Yinghuangia sp. ASG 101]
MVHTIDTRHGAADGFQDIVQLAYDPERRDPAAVSEALARLAARIPRPAHARRDVAEVRRVGTLLDILHALSSGLAEDIGIHAQLTHQSEDRDRLLQLATLTCESAWAANELTQAAHLAAQSALGGDQPGAARAYTRTYDRHLDRAATHLRNASLFGRSPRPAAAVPAVARPTPATAAPHPRSVAIRR